jgi:transcription elongation factor/antiterminator RfaH
VTNSQSAPIPIGEDDRLVQWLVVRTKPRHERVAVSHLGQREVEAYCPMYLEPKWRQRSGGIPVPLFTSYIFVRMDPGTELNAVAYCPGVAHLVRFDRQPALVDQEVIDAIRQREGVRGFVVPPEVEIGIKLGNKVMIMAGPLTGMEGLFRGYLRGGERANVLIEFLRQQNLVEVDTADLEAARA